MGFSLENFFSPKVSLQQNIGVEGYGHVGTGGTLNSVENQQSNTVFDMLKEAMTSGDILQGKVLSAEEGKLEILLQNGQSFTAGIEKGLSLDVGEQVMFSVKNMKNNLIELKPLFTNTINTSTITKALEEASMPINEKNISMVEKMMTRGMRIQKDALWDMKRIFHQFPEADMEDILALKSLKLPINSENLRQIQAYKNNENVIIKPVVEMVEKIPEAVEDWITAGNADEGVSLYRELLNFSEENVGFEKLNEEEIKELSLFMEKLDLPMEKAEEYMKNEPDRQMVLQIFKEQIWDNTSLSKATIGKILKEPFFQKMTQGILLDSISLKPEEVKEYKNIEQLYERLYDKAGKILETLSGKEETPLFKMASQLKNNVDFVNQVNQIFQYIQLPLKFSESHANGELFVYGNGKKLSLKEGNVTAFLHLSMEYLGNVDVHVEMNIDKQVTTHFYLEKEEMLNFIYEHIEMLNDRLKKRGYGAVTQVHFRENTESTPIKEAFEQKKQDGILLSTQSFDALA